MEAGVAEDSAKARSRARALQADALASARKVRQAIEATDDIANAFDSITYDKGSAVMGMFERGSARIRSRRA